MRKRTVPLAVGEHSLGNPSGCTAATSFPDVNMLYTVSIADAGICTCALLRYVVSELNLQESAVQASEVIRQELQAVTSSKCHVQSASMNPLLPASDVP